MNTITKKFLAYKSKPKAQPEPYGPQPRVVYNVEGFISKEETVLERMGRLTEARARGEWFSKDNNCFYYNHRGHTGGFIRRDQVYENKKMARQGESQWKRISKTTQAPVMRGIN